MQELINFLRTDNYLLILNILIIVLLIGFIALLVSNMKSTVVREILICREE